MSTQQTHSEPFYPVVERSTEPLQVVHFDLSGEIQVRSLGGSKLWITFIDDYTRFTYVTFLKSKESQSILDAFRGYQAWAERRTGKKIKAILTDGGREYLGVRMQYLWDTWVQHQPTQRYSPQSNGVAERYNRTMMDMARPMMLAAGAP